MEVLHNTILPDSGKEMLRVRRVVRQKEENKVRSAKDSKILLQSALPPY